MVRIGAFLLLLSLTACVSATPPQHFPKNCLAQASIVQLLEENWLNQAQVWRLRQATLLEAGGKSFPLEGFLRLDLLQGDARLVAMNETGLVLFDLQVTRSDYHLHRAIPQLREVDHFAKGVAQSLRHIFLPPQPQEDDLLENRENIQQLSQISNHRNVDFSYDCQGDLRTIRLKGEDGNWLVAYDEYRSFDNSRIPTQIIMNDYRQRLKLSLWVREGKHE